MGTLSMSEKERRRLEVLIRVRDDEITLAKAAELMHLSYRQAKRVWLKVMRALRTGFGGGSPTMPPRRNDGSG